MSTPARRYGAPVPADEPAPRHAAASDLRVAAELLDAFNREFDEPSPGPAVLAERLLVLLDRDGAALLVAGDPPVALAFLTFRAVLWDDGPVALLEELYVRPDLRSRGIGGRLLAEVVAACRARGSTELTIDVDFEDADARRFYERHGLTARSLLFERDLR